MAFYVINTAIDKIGKWIFFIFFLSVQYPFGSFCDYNQGRSEPNPDGSVWICSQRWGLNSDIVQKSSRPLWRDSMVRVSKVNSGELYSRKKDKKICLKC